MKRLLALFANNKESLGEKGERFAALWLKKQGYKLLHQNYKIGKDEADLIAIDPDRVTIVIVEVKTRSSSEPAPESSINRKKQFNLARFASRLGKRKEFSGRPFRFDAIAIVWPDGEEPQIKHYEAAFDSPF
ncbi:MAG: YraN family protein [Planctomycetes bacterium]|nr:YraN family protein [Planctomycetota bacterium]